MADRQLGTRIAQLAKRELGPFDSAICSATLEAALSADDVPELSKAIRLAFVANLGWQIHDALSHIEEVDVALGPLIKQAPAILYRFCFDVKRSTSYGLYMFWDHVIVGLHEELRETGTLREYYPLMCTALNAQLFYPTASLRRSAEHGLYLLRVASALYSPEMDSVPHP